MKRFMTCLFLAASSTMVSYENYNAVMKVRPAKKNLGLSGNQSFFGGLNKAFSLVSKTKIPVNGPSAIATYGNIAYITNFVGNSISVVNTDNDELLATLTDPKMRWPYNIVLSGDGGYAYIGFSFCPDEHGLLILDTATGIFYAPGIYGKSYLAIDNQQKQLFVIQSIADPYPYEDLSYTYLCIYDLTNPTNPTLINQIRLDLQTDPYLGDNIYPPQSITFDQNHIVLGSVYNDLSIFDAPTFPYLFVFDRNNLNVAPTTVQIPYEEDIKLYPSFLPGNNGLKLINEKVYGAMGYIYDIKSGESSKFTSELLRANSIVYDGKKYIYIANTQLKTHTKVPVVPCASSGYKGYTAFFAGFGLSGVGEWGSFGAHTGTSILQYDITKPTPTLKQIYSGFNCPQEMAILPGGDLYVLDGSGSVQCYLGTIQTGRTLKKINAKS